MDYISDNEDGRSWREKTTPGNWILEYALDKEDYFLNYRISWKEIETDIFRFIIGPQTIEIPSGFYVMICDEVGDIDWILVDEIISRPLQIGCLSRKQDAWKPMEPRLDWVDYGTIFWPQTKNVIPVYNNSCGVVLSEKDSYRSTKDSSINMFLV